uniref:EB domain-containing protein n=1 Tax=Rhabditophanes sp. KR3021 TaxID=114890 RepID=A0AC35TGN8_9BILA
MILASCFIVLLKLQIVCSSDPWYLPRPDIVPVEQVISNNLTVNDIKCDEGTLLKIIHSQINLECSTTMDCSSGLSCFQSTYDLKGCCLKALKPNETGCVINDQCRNVCESTRCDNSQTPSKCVCNRGYHFLFNKCWKKCPSFAYPDPVEDSSGFSQCIVKIDPEQAVRYMKRFARHLKRTFC